MDRIDDRQSSENKKYREKHNSQVVAAGRMEDEQPIKATWVWCECEYPTCKISE